MAVIIPLALSYAGSAAGTALFAGTALAAYGSAIGGIAGSLIGSLFAPTQKVQGPRIDDKKVIGSSYGTPIPFLIGHPRLAPQIVWASEKREIATTAKSGKGGPKVESTTYTYEVDLLLQFSCNRMAGIRKLWYNGQLIWTAGNDADYASINASGDFARAVRVFNGDPAQLPYSTYEAAVGIGNAPAFRGSLTIGIDGLQLGSGGQIGNLTAEVVDAATTVMTQNTLETITAKSVFGGASPFVNQSGAWNAVPQNAWYASNIWDVYYTPLGSTPQFMRTINVGAWYKEAFGQKDEPVLLIATSNLTAPAIMYWLDDSRLPVTFNMTLGTLNRFAKQGDAVVAASSTTRLLRFDLSDGLVLNARYEIVVATPFSSVAIIDNLVYALEQGSGARMIRKYNLADLSAAGTMTSPSLIAEGEIIGDDLGNLYAVGSTVLYQWDGASWVTRMTFPSGFGAAGASGTTPTATFIDGVLHTNPVLTGGGNSTVPHRVSWRSISADDIPLATAIERIAARAEVDAAEFNLTALAGKFVRADIITSSTPRQALEILASAYFFEWVGLKAVLRGGAAVATIPWEDLGSVADGDQPEDPAPLAGKNDIEIPAYVHIKGMNVDNDYQDGTESSDRLVTESNAVQMVEMPLGLTPSELKLIAIRTAADLQVAKISVSFSVQRKYDRLEPTDVVLLTLADGSLLRVRILRKTKAGGLLKFEGMLDDDSVYSLTGATDTDYTSSTTVYRAPDSRAIPLDIPPLRDADAYASAMYVAIDHLSATTKPVTLFIGPDEDSYEMRGQVNDEAPAGFAESVPGAWTFNVMDNANTFIVSLGDAAMFSVSRDDVFNTIANAWALGAPGRWEIGQSMNVASLGGGRFLLSGHLRGRRGTEQLTGTHFVGDTFVLLEPNGLLKPSFDISELNQPRYFKGITAGRALSSGITTAGVNTGEILRPFNPVNVRKVKANNNDQLLSWDWRTRLSGEFPSGAEIPFSETVTNYEIDFYTSGAFTTKAGTLTASTNSRNVTSAEQTAMGLTPGATLYTRVYQLSALVGRGHYEQATL